MTKTKSTKRALLMSGLALLLCVSMFIGSTFAWFTDSVTSGRNKIVAGNLDVVLEYKTPDSDDWAEVTSDTVLFSEDSLWEPGHTEVVALRIRNAGTLALKYDLATTVYEEKAGTNVNGDPFLLSNYLDVYSAMSMAEDGGIVSQIMQSLVLGGRDAATGKGTIMEKVSFGESIFAEDPAKNDLNPGEAHFTFIAIQMPETVGNEANYKTGTEAPFISFGVTLLATQATVESDSFGSDYDVNAEWPIDKWDGSTVDTSWYNTDETSFVISTVEEMLGLESLVNDQAISFEGKVVELAKDLDMTGVEWEPIGHYFTSEYPNSTMFKGTFDGKGHTISNLSTSTYYGAYKNEGSALFGTVGYGCVIKNLNMTNVKSWNIYGYGGAVVGSVHGGDVTIENVHVDNAIICAGRHVGGFIGITGRTGHTYDCTVTFANCSMKNVEMVYVHGNNSTDNIIGDPGLQFKNTLTLNGLDAVAKENVTVTQDRDLFYSYQVGQ